MPKNKLTPLIMLRSVIFWTVVVIFAFIITTIATLAIFTNVKFRHKIATKWSKFFGFLIQFLCRTNYQVIGRENILTTPCIIASNHQSMWETVIFNIIFPPHVWIMKKELLNVPLFGWTIRTLAPIAINRRDKRGSVSQILEQGYNRLQNGFYIMLYPEGTRMQPGDPIHFKSGVGRMSKNFNLPVIPVSHNAGYVLPRRSFWIYPGHVTVIIDKPVYPTAEDTPDTITKKLEEIIGKNVKTLLRTNNA